MKMKKLIALATLAVVPSFASAGLLTFDSIQGKIDSPYTEGGFRFTITGGNPPADSPHFGDALGIAGVLDWHDLNDGLDGNPGSARAFMTRVDGGAFNVFGFDVISQSSLIVKTTTNGVTSEALRPADGTHVTDFSNITWLEFDISGCSGPCYGGVDNICASAVPGPGSLALLGSWVGRSWFFRAQS